METTFTGSVRVWLYAGDPDSTVHNEFDVYAEVGDRFLNTSTHNMFVCYQGGESQLWERYVYFSQLVQADWNQANSSLLDYIKNKPTIPAAQIQSDWTQTNSGSLDFIKNKPALSFTTPTFASATTSTRLSTTRSAWVSYTFPTTMTSLITSQTLTATLQYADDAGFTTNVVSFNNDVQGCSGILSLTLSGRLQVQGRIPANKYRRVVLAQTGGATIPTTLSSGQEVLE